MEITVKTSDISKQQSACLVVGVYESQQESPASQTSQVSQQLSASAKLVDKLANGLISEVLKQGDIKGKIGQTLVLHQIPGIAASRVMLVGCGIKKDLGLVLYRKLLGSMASAIDRLAIEDAASYLAELKVKKTDLHNKIRQSVGMVHSAMYRSDQLKSDNNKRPVNLCKLILVISTTADVAEAKRAVQVGQAIANGMVLAKTLGDLPGNICTPSYLAEQAKALGKRFKSLVINIVNEAAMQKLKMGALLSVSKGSREPPKLINISYNGGKKNQKPIVLVGKGVTFDSGGISIKPSAAMDEMKYDMCGAASVFGTLSAVAEMKLPINVIGIVPSVENLPDGSASKPGDIVTSMSGQTIEVLNTDAEGRLILCDALTYCGRYKPEFVIDIATLTGACVVALGKHATGLLSNDESIVSDLKQAGESACDRVWQMPLWDEYQPQLQSNFADIANIGGRDAGTITAACFLSRFTENYRWAHLDIAGTAWKSGKDKGATGRPVPLLCQYLMDRCG